MDGCSSASARKAFLVVSVVMNLGLLVYFKYVNFFLDSLREVVTAFGGTASIPVLEVVLPVGISFYTFEAINYTADVYTHKTRAERDLMSFMLFITFFPHLVAGPIVRAKDFLPQIHCSKRWDWARLRLGAEYFLRGLIKKIVIADRMAAFADPVFGEPGQYASSTVWIAVVAYALQIYCDFSGYTDMALGTAHMLGYKLAQNFNMPYLATNISEFWRRWHISLSSWLRDYLFIPLGGSRGTSRQTDRNLMITMLLGGLWHGANWTFVIWGAYHGLLLILHRHWKLFVERQPGSLPAYRAIPTKYLGIALTFVCVCVGWVFFRCQTFSAATTMLTAMFWPHDGLAHPHTLTSFWWLTSLVIAAHVVRATGLWNWFTGHAPAPAWAFGYSIACSLVLAQSALPDATQAFIYFQF